VIAVSPGGAHTLILKHDGSLWAVGLNKDGQLGDGTNTDRHLPVKVVDSGVTRISAGSWHSLFIKEDGSLWGMGGNGGGRLGDGTDIIRNVPVRVIDSNVTEISGGMEHSLFLKSDGSAWAMGGNESGQLGDGTKTNSYVPKRIIDANVSSVYADVHNSYFLMSNGTLWGTGENSQAQLAENPLSSIDREVSPKQIAQDVVAAAVGHESVLYQKADGILYGHGNSRHGQMADGNASFSHLPYVLEDGNVTRISTIKDHSLYLKADGSLWSLGSDGSDKLGDGFLRGHRSDPFQVVESNVTQLSAGWEHSLFVKADGSLWGMGGNANGRLTSESNATYSTPIRIQEANVTTCAAGNVHSLFVKTDGSLWAMGHNKYGQLGFDENSRFPEAVPQWIWSTKEYSGTHPHFFSKSFELLEAVKEARLTFTCDNSSEVYLNGNSLGSNSDWQKPVYIEVSEYLNLGSNLIVARAQDNGNGIAGFVLKLYLTTISEQKLFIITDSSWQLSENEPEDWKTNGVTEGRNPVVHGGMGMEPWGNLFSDVVTPVKIVEANVTAVEAGWQFSLFLKADGSVWSMGSNANGRLGYGGLGDRSSPVRIMDSGAAAIAAGESHAFILKADGSLWVFGYKEAGRLGELAKADRSVPLKIVEEGVVSVTGGTRHSLFVKTDGSLWAMGHNGMGQLGLDPGSISHKLHPVRVMDSGVAEVAAGNKHSMVLMKDGSLLTFGDDTYGQRGAGRMVWTYEPVQVTDGLGIP
jgi:alpha-tubulin suppressor-like RCC1 family protein